jgi:hypothetical protein
MGTGGCDFRFFCWQAARHTTPPTQRAMGSRTIRITHRSTGSLIAEGPIGWGITRFDGACYIRRKYLKTAGFRPNFIPGLCPYKFFYVWMDLKMEDGRKVPNLGWLYWLPNPLLPFICFRVAVPSHHPELHVEEIGEAAAKRPYSRNRSPATG